GSFDAQQLREHADVDHVHDEPAELHVGGDGLHELRHRHRVDDAVVGQRRQLDRLVRHDHRARAHLRHVGRRGLGVHHHEDLVAAAARGPAVLAGADGEPRRQAGDVRREQVLAAHRDAHLEDGAEQHVVGRLAAGAVDSGHVDAEVVHDRAHGQRTLRARSERVKYDSRRGRAPRGAALDPSWRCRIVPVMTDLKSMIEPTPLVLATAQRWLLPVQERLGPDFLSAYITGGALNEGFDPLKRHINVLVVTKDLAVSRLDPIAASVPLSNKPPHIDPLFVTLQQVQRSLDVFPIEWTDLKERHWTLEGVNLFDTLDVPETYLRLQIEQELRGKHLRLLQE